MIIHNLRIKFNERGWGNDQHSQTPHNFVWKNISVSVLLNSSFSYLGGKAVSFDWVYCWEQSWEIVVTATRWDDAVLVEGVVSAELLLVRWWLSDEDNDVDPVEEPLRDWSECNFGLVPLPLVLLLPTPPPPPTKPEFTLLLLLGFVLLEYDLVVGLDPTGLDVRLPSDMLLR